MFSAIRIHLWSTIELVCGSHILRLSFSHALEGQDYNFCLHSFWSREGTHHWSNAFSYQAETCITALSFLSEIVLFRFWLTFLNVFLISKFLVWRVLVIQNQQYLLFLIAKVVCLFQLLLRCWFQRWWLLYRNLLHWSLLKFHLSNLHFLRYLSFSSNFICAFWVLRSLYTRFRAISWLPSSLEHRLIFIVLLLVFF